MKDFKKYYIIPATPEEIYLALTNPFTIELWTGSPAIMETVPETEFSLWDGDIVGKNIEFVPNEKIVQEWFFGEREEKSIVTIKLHEHPKGTSVEIRQSNIPDEDYDDFASGWDDYYIGQLLVFFDED